MTKTTKKDMYNALLRLAEVQANDKMVAFINHEIELLERKNSAKKATPQQEENNAIKVAMIDIMTEPMTATQIMDAVEPMFPNLERPLTNQRISALLRQLGKKGTQQVNKFQEKRVTYFVKK